MLPALHASSEAAAAAAAIAGGGGGGGGDGNILSDASRVGQVLRDAVMQAVQGAAADSGGGGGGAAAPAAAASATAQRRVTVGPLNELQCNEATVRGLLETCGTVSSVRVGDGRALVEFATEEGAAAALRLSGPPLPAGAKVQVPRDVLETSTKFGMAIAANRPVTEHDVEYAMQLASAKQEYLAWKQGREQTVAERKADKIRRRELERRRRERRARQREGLSSATDSEFDSGEDTEERRQRRRARHAGGGSDEEESSGGGGGRPRAKRRRKSGAGPGGGGGAAKGGGGGGSDGGRTSDSDTASSLPSPPRVAYQ
eukprot:Rhum_TRINITY_DN8222_c1_g1::Rhum_TRINITY_DN8222_c1_g1_i1::g.26881::m.26881